MSSLALPANPCLCIVVSALLDVRAAVDIDFSSGIQPSIMWNMANSIVHDCEATQNGYVTAGCFLIDGQLQLATYSVTPRCRRHSL